MTYCETGCQLCGVSFAIGRLRRADEPEDAAWRSWNGRGFVDIGEVWNLAEDGQSDEVDMCEEGSGCHEGTRVGEHIAGPGCVSEFGYSGHRISLEEMKGFQAIQCLVKKEAGWMPEDDDQSFETEGNYFLTGIGNDPGVDGLVKNIDPVRHDVSEIFISEYYHERQHGPEYGLPFHSTCFDLYKKFCSMRIGKVDVECLFIWQRLFTNDAPVIHEWPSDPAVKSGREQEWKHEPGLEYLVANPIDIPGLSQLMISQERRAKNRTIVGDSERSSDSENSTANTVVHTPNPAHDPFSPLSVEIIGMILDYLGSKDIASLRLATPVFRQLPTILFRRLLLEDMPWFFEAKDLDVAKFNWYELYYALKSSWKNLKGFRNRRRIWRDLEVIVRVVEEARKIDQFAAI